MSGSRNVELLKAKRNRSGKLHTHGLTVLPTGNPAWHGFDDTLRLSVKRRVYGADYAHIADRTILLNNKGADNAALDSIFLSHCGIIYVATDVLAERSITAREPGHLLHHFVHAVLDRA